MTKRCREAIQVRETAAQDRDDAPPTAFRWRGRTYTVQAVLGHWREDAGWWAGGDMAVPQRDLWRVEARAHDAAGCGIYELVREAGAWRLDRVWD